MPIKSLLAAKGARLMDGKGRTTKFPPCDMIFFVFDKHARPNLVPRGCDPFG